MLTDDELMRYSRQVLLDGWDVDAQLRLKHSRIVMVGAGGLGCPAAETLARAGVGNIHLIDDDVIEISNLQRQTLFLPQDLGQHKAQVAAARLLEINELITVSYEVVRVEAANAAELLKLPAKVETATQTTALTAAPQLTPLPDLLLDCTDNFAIRELLNRISVAYAIPLLSASAIGMTGQLALYEPALSSGCYHCVFGDSIASSTNSTENDTSAEQNCANSGVLASTTAIMGTLQANAALQYLGLQTNPLAQQLLLWDGQRMRQRNIGYRQDPACPICGPDA
jgi:adenylyltransferase/sulfurtransferase